MTTTAVIIIAAVIVVAIVAWFLFRQKRSKNLRSQFGPEYENAIHQHGSSSKGEDGIQTGFVDEPRAAVRQADELVASAIKRLAESFAGARSSLEGQWARGDQVNTEDLRVALRKYRSFFQKLMSV